MPEAAVSVVRGALALFASLSLACSHPQPQSEDAAAPAEYVAPNACTDVAPSRAFSCAQQVAWGKCGNPWMRGFCDRSCGRCYEGERSCASAPKGEPIPATVLRRGALSAFPDVFDLYYGNPNHPDKDSVRVGREENGRYVIAAVSLTTYGVDRETVVLDLETGGLTRSEVRSGHDLGTTRAAHPAQGGERGAYLTHLAALREIVARVQAGHVWREVGFDTGPRAELIGALCHIDALASSVSGAS